MNLLELVRKYAFGTPDAVAVSAADGNASYLELAERTAALAHAYGRLGVRAGDRVAIVLPSGREAVAASLAAFCRRAAYVPVDPAQPPVRATAMLRRCAPRLCVGVPAPGWEDADLRSPDSLAGPWHRLDAVSARRRSDVLRAVDELRPGPGDDVAYVIHTSGSTGFPKAVEIEHHSVHNLLRDMDSRAPVEDGHVGALWASPDFDASVWEAWSTLCRGGALAVVPPEDRWDGRRFAAFLDRHHVANAFVPPAYLPDLLDLIERDPAACESLRRIMSGAEPIPLGLLQDLLRLRPNMNIINAYGPAEATVCATLYLVPRTGGNRTDRTPIGTAVRGNTLTIVGPDGLPSPGGVGELVISGVGVGRGYLPGTGGPDGRFVAASGGQPGVRAYRTGDRVQLLPDGNLLFLGRVDRQLKVRGYRIEPGEVEAAVRATMPVREVVVDQRTLAGVGPALVAYIVPSDARPFDPEECRAELRDRLPAYAVPTALVPIEAVPLTKNGKVDRAALAALPLPSAGVRPGRHAPSDGHTDPLLAAVLAAWRAELGDVVRAELGFVDLGGTSLPAIRVADRLRVATGRAVSAADVLGAASAGALAVRIAEAPAGRGGPGPVAAGRDRGPLSPNQLGLWLHDQLHPSRKAYLEPMCFVLPRGTDLSRLGDAVNRATAAHPVLGATTARDGAAVYLLLGRHRIDLEFGMRASGGSGGHARAIEQILDEHFDVDGGPLTRFAVLRNGVGHDLLLLVWHHLVVDGWSVRLLLADLAHCYDDPDYHPVASPLTLCDANTWLIERSGAPDVAARTEAVAASLADMRSLAARHVDAGEAAGPVCHVVLGIELTKRLRAMARQTGLVPISFLRTAYEHALAHLLGEDRLLLGCAVEGRTEPEFRSIAGHFVNTVLVPATAGTARPDLATVAAASIAFARARAEQEDLPFGQVVAAIRATRPSTLTSVPQLYFSLDEDYPLVLAGEPCQPYPVTVQRALFDANLVLRSGPNEIRGEFEYRQSLLDACEARTLVDLFTATVADLTERTPAD